MADTASFHANENLAGLNGGRWNLLHVHHAEAAVDGRMHGIRNGDRFKFRYRQKNLPGRARPERIVSAAGTTPAAGPLDGVKYPLKLVLYRTARPNAGPY